MSEVVNSILVLAGFVALGWALCGGSLKSRPEVSPSQRAAARIRRAEHKGNAWAWAVYNVDGISPAQIEARVDGRRIGSEAVGLAFNSGARRAVEEMKYYESLVALTDFDTNLAAQAHA